MEHTLTNLLTAVASIVLSKGIHYATEKLPIQTLEKKYLPYVAIGASTACTILQAHGVSPDTLVSGVVNGVLGVGAYSTIKNAVLKR